MGHLGGQRTGDMGYMYMYIMANVPLLMYTHHNVVRSILAIFMTLYIPLHVGPSSLPPARDPGTPGLVFVLRPFGIPFSPPLVPFAGRNLVQKLPWRRGWSNGHDDNVMLLRL